MRRNIIAFLLFLNGVAAALTQPGPANQNLPKTAAAKQVVAKQAPPQNSNCVGVVSNLGEKFAVKKIVGYIIFVGEEKAVPVESWHIDDLAAAKISGLLGKGIAVRRIPYRKDALASLAKPKLSHDREADFGEIIRAITAGTGCARYVVVTRGGSFYGTTNLSLSGLGIVAGQKPYFTGDLYNLYALIAVRVYDGDTLSLLTRKAASIGQPTFLAMIHGPHREVDESFWPVSPDLAVQNVKLRDAIRELVAQSLDATLPELKLRE